MPGRGDDANNAAALCFLVGGEAEGRNCGSGEENVSEHEFETFDK